jgi:hypothetical protein
MIIRAGLAGAAALLTLTACETSSTTDPAATSAATVTVTVTETATATARVPVYFPPPTFNAPTSNPLCDQLDSLTMQAAQADLLAMNLQRQADDLRFQQGPYGEFTDAENRALDAQRAAQQLHETVDQLRRSC